jgi:hypothetical protein
VANFDVLLGVASTSPLRWGIPCAYFVIAVLGVIWALVLNRRRPDVYRAIGLGAKSATATATTEAPDVMPDKPDFGWTKERS